MIGPKAIDCLAVCELSALSPERDARYDAACRRWSEKAVLRKLEELSDRNYIEYGVSVPYAWLTEKGRHALSESRAKGPQP